MRAHARGLLSLPRHRGWRSGRRSSLMPTRPTTGPERQPLSVRKTLHSAMVEVATVSSKGQVTLPASIRKKLRIRQGSKLIFLEDGQEVRLLAGEDLEKRFSLFEARAREVVLTARRLGALVKEARGRLWRERNADRD